MSELKLCLTNAAVSGQHYIQRMHRMGVPSVTNALIDNLLPHCVNIVNNIDYLWSIFIHVVVVQLLFHLCNTYLEHVP